MIKIKRALFLVGFIVLFTVLFVINWTFLLLDYLFYPKFRRIKVREPVFITGLTRTGSTLLYNAMHLDHRNFTSMKLWEIILAPSITQRKLVRFFTRPAPVYNFLAHRLLPFIEHHFFGGIRNIHPARFLEIEEDEFVFYQIFSSGSLFFLFPRIRHFLRYSQFDESFGEKTRRRSMKFYKRIIQRHLYFHGCEKQYLSKSPSHTARIKSLKGTFPNLKIIYLLRDPKKSVPSTFSLFSAIREGNFVPVTDNSEFLEDGLELADHWLWHPLNILHQSPKLPLLIIHSTDLFTKTNQTIMTIYREFDIRLPDDFMKRLESYNARQHKSSHSYKAEDFGLTEELLEKRFMPVYNALLKEKCDI